MCKVFEATVLHSSHHAFYCMIMVSQGLGAVQSLSHVQFFIPPPSPPPLLKTGGS